MENKPFECFKRNRTIREKLLQWIVESWGNKDEIKEEIIIKSFLTCGITNNTDCSEVSIDIINLFSLMFSSIIFPFSRIIQAAGLPAA